MVGMFMGNDDGINVRGWTAQSVKSAKNFASADAGIKENTGPLGFNQCCIARAARG